MRIAFSFSKAATLVVLLSISFAFVAWGQDSVPAYFEGTGTLSPTSWSAGDSLIYNGNLHSTKKLTGTKQIAVYIGKSNANKVDIRWAPLGDGCETAYTGYGGVVFMQTGNYQGNGYFANYYNGRISLFKITAGVTAGSGTNVNVSSPPTMAAGSLFSVQVNTATGKFEYFLDGVLLGTITNTDYSLASACYGGALLYSGELVNNDIEEMTFSTYTPSSSTDTTPPAAATISAGSPTSSSVTVTWNATADDGATGAAATTYQLRYSTATITEANFASATRFTTTAPKAPGSPESYTVTGLSASTKYYFALKVYDEAGNPSPLSNVASATTAAGSGGGGGGGTVSGNWNCLGVDDFNRSIPGSDWDAPNAIIENNELAANPNRTTWTMSTFIKPGANKSAGADSIKISMNMGASATLVNNHIPVGFALMLQTPSASSDGYFLRRASGELVLYQITGGGTIFNTQVKKASSVALATPAPGDKITAIVKQQGATANILFFINDVFDSRINDIALPVTPPETWYVGVVQYENAGNNSNIDNYQVCLPNLGSASATTIVYASGNNQSAPINQYVADSLKVKVTDDAGNPVSNVVVDFAVTQGTGTIETGTFDGKIWKEVESGILGIPIAYDTTAAAASGGHAIKTAYVGGYRYRTAVTIPIYNPEERSYYFYLRARTTSGQRNTVIIKYSDKDSLLMDFNDLSGAWGWQRHKDSFRLPKGLQNIRLVIYDPGWDWDKIALIGTGLSGPSGSTMGDTGPNLSNISNAAGFAAARLKFGADADTNVVVSAIAYRADGTTPLNGAPVNFTLDPTPGPAVSMIKDPELTDPILGTRDETAGATLIAIIQDANGNGVPGTTVNWSLISGVGAALARTSTTSDENGKASVTMTLGLVDTLFTVQAAAVNAGGTALTNSPLTFRIKTGKPPASMSKSSGDNQIGTVGTMLPNLLKVKVLSETGANYPNYPVVFTVKSGEGKISSAAAPSPVTTLKVLTDANGDAAVYLTLGAKPGANTVEAKLQGLASIPVQLFTATGLIGPPSILAIVSGNNQSRSVGLALHDSLVVKVTDLQDNGITGHQVVFTLIDGTNAFLETPGVRTLTRYTNPSGRAAVKLTMGSAVGEINTVRATATGLTPENVTFTATATEAIASRIEYVSGNNQDTTVTARLGKPFVVQVFGPYDAVISGHSVRFKVVKGGGNFDGLIEKVVQSDVSGMASATLTTGKTAGDSANVVEVSSFQVDQPSIPLAGSPLRLWANGRPGPAAKLVKLAATDNQTKANGLILDQPIKAAVTDVYGNPIAGRLRRHLCRYRRREHGQDRHHRRGRLRQRALEDAGAAGRGAGARRRPAQRRRGPDRQPRLLQRHFSSRRCLPDGQVDDSRHPSRSRRQCRPPEHQGAGHGRQRHSQGRLSGLLRGHPGRRQGQRSQ